MASRHHTSSSYSSPWRGSFKSLCLVASLTIGSSMAQQQYLQQTYCSSQNTGSSNLVESSIYQSLGNCQTKCRGGYAYGIVLNRDCWCSNTAPSNQVSTDRCSDACFGYPYERCGNSDNNLYGYIATGQTALISSGPSSSSSISSSSRLSSSSAASESTTATPVTSQSLRTVSGSVITATVTIIPTSVASDSDRPQKSSKISGGSIAGIVVGVVVGVIAIIAAVVIGLCCWRRRRYGGEDGEGGLNRNTSVLSRNILLGGSRGTNGAPYNAQNPNMQERRSSKPLVTDARLNPNAFMQHDDGSRSSFVSVQDNRDYTRTLNVRNPDPYPPSTPLH